MLFSEKGERMPISDAEKIFVLHGVQDDSRSDGRSRKEIRPIKFETELVVSCNGSANLRLANTDVLVGVKAELDLEGQSDHGRIEFFVDCSANATPDFEGDYILYTIEKFSFRSTYIRNT